MLAAVFSCTSSTIPVFVGGSAGEDGKGLTIFDFETGTGKMVQVSKWDTGPEPTYFCFSQKDSLLIVANEVMNFKNSDGGGLSTFRYNSDDASLEKTGELLIPYGGPCFVSLSADGGHVFLANYPMGSVVVVKLSDGIPVRITDTILYVKVTPEVSHAHMIRHDPSGRMVYVSDLGQDMIFRYNFNTVNGKLIPVDTLVIPEGYGPRHFDFNPDGSFLYIINELSSKITVFSLVGKPALIQTVSTVSSDFTGDNFCADIHMSKDGRYLYGSNRGENTIVTFSVNPDGTIKPIGHTPCGGDWPRNFTIDPSGQFLIAGNQRSDNIVVMKIDQSTGVPYAERMRYKIKAPACIKFVQ